MINNSFKEGVMTSIKNKITKSCKKLLLTFVPSALEENWYAGAVKKDSGAPGGFYGYDRGHWSAIA